MFSLDLVSLGKGMVVNKAGFGILIPAEIGFGDLGSLDCDGVGLIDILLFDGFVLSHLDFHVLLLRFLDKIRYLRHLGSFKYIDY